MSKQEVIDVLDKLGALGSAEAIRLYFRAEEIQGSPGSASYCPVANYVTREVGECDFEISPLGWRSSDKVHGRVISRTLHIHVPIAVTEFIKAFDNSEFPELDAYDGY